jgi:predicted esterase
VSNGGISSFRIAAQDPSSIQSLLVFPGFARSDEDRAALPSMVDIPVRLFVGADDMGWIPAMQETHDILLNAGADVTLEILPGEGHRIESLSDGVRIFDELDALR